MLLSGYNLSESLLKVISLSVLLIDIVLIVNTFALASVNVNLELFNIVQSSSYIFDKLFFQ